QAEAEVRAVEHRSLVHDTDGMYIARIIERWPADHLEAHRPMHHMHHAINMMTQTRLFRVRLDGHEVGHLTDTIRRHKSSDEDVRLRKIHLLSLHGRRVGRSNAEEATLLHVEQRAKDTGRIEVRNSAPIYRTVPADERNGLQVADDAIVLDGQIALWGMEQALMLGAGAALRRCAYHVLPL